MALGPRPASSRPILNAILTPGLLRGPLSELRRRLCFGEGPLGARGRYVVEQQRKPDSRAERLQDLFRQLPPKTLALLTSEFEKVLAKGEDGVFAELVLGELRKVVRKSDTNDRMRLDDLQRTVFGVVEPFLVDANTTRPGQIKRSSLGPVWTWLTQTALAKEAEAFRDTYGSAKHEGRSGEMDQTLRRFQLAAAEAIGQLISPKSQGGDRQRSLGRVGAPAVVEDLPAIQIIFANRDALESFRARIPRIMSSFADNQVAAIKDQIMQLPSLQNPQVLPFVISTIMQRMTSPWQIIRLAISFASSDEETRVAAAPYGLAVSMALYDLAVLVDELRTEIRRGQFDRTVHQLKSLHDGVRDLRTELDFRSDSQWGRQLSSIRADISNALTSELESVPGRVRRLLRHRSDKDINAGARLDVGEADETVALVNFVIACRNYASELAISEVTLRSFSELQHYLESTTEALVESLRHSEAKVRAFRQTQAELAIRFCEAVFGHDYAALMTKAAELALAGERKSSRSG